jgi:hypothetical protein
MLAAFDPDETLKSVALDQLLLDPDPLQRLEAAFCLGYLQADRSPQILATLAAADPPGGVRRQAIKSLSKYPPRGLSPAPDAAAGVGRRSARADHRACHRRIRI